MRTTKFWMAVVAAIGLCGGAIARADIIRLEAEDYKVGGEGVGYHDDGGKDGDGAYRPPDTVDVEMGSEGYNVGWTNGGEWIVLTVDPGVWTQDPTFTAGNYWVSYRAASGGSGGNVHVEIGGTLLSTTTSVSGTGGWQNYATTINYNPITISTAGPQEIKMVFETGGLNLNWIELTTDDPGPEPIPPDPLMVMAPNGSGGYSAYMLVETTKNLTDAKAAAQAMTFPGMPGVPASAVTGHLATYVSEAEFSHLEGMVRQHNNGDPFIGLTDDETIIPGAVEKGDGSAFPTPANGALPNETPGSEERGAGFRFVDGTPNVFHQRTGSGGASIWNGGEPNDWGGNEDAVQLTTGGGLNDNAVGSGQKYLVEWDLNLADRPMLGPAGGAGYWGIREVALLSNSVERTAEAVAFLYYNEINNGNIVVNAGTRFEGTSPVINFADPQDSGGGGDFPLDTPFLSDTPNADDNFVFVANGTVMIPEAGLWSFRLRGDDGGMIRLPGQSWVKINSSDGGKGYVEGDSLIFNDPTGNANLVGVANLPAGPQKIEVIWFEAGGGANVEVAAAKGDTTNLADFSIIGAPEMLAAVPGISNAVVTQSLPGEYNMAAGNDTDSIENLADAVAALALSRTNGTETTILASRINHGDPDNGDGTQNWNRGSYGADSAFPIDDPAGNGIDDNNFGIDVIGTLNIPASGTYYIGFNSDDGASLQIVGQNWKGIVSDGTGHAAIAGDTLSNDWPTGWSYTVGEIDLLAGSYDFALTFFEWGGGGFFEMFGGTVPGVYYVIEEGMGTFRVVPAGLELVPEPATLALLGLGALALVMRRKR